jgi:hypothetical protein
MPAQRKKPRWKTGCVSAVSSNVLSLPNAMLVHKTNQKTDLVIGMCLGKKRYTKNEASKVAVLVENNGRRIRKYGCPFCGGWHLTHKRRKGDR